MLGTVHSLARYFGFSRSSAQNDSTVCRAVESDWSKDTTRPRNISNTERNRRFRYTANWEIERLSP